MAPARGMHNVLNALVGALLGVDIVCVMATALVEEAPHEYLGIALVVLSVVHIVLNRRWFTTLAKGRWTAARVVQAVVIVAVAICLVAQIASAVVLSKHALWFLPAVPGASWARRAHMICSYWMFVLAFAHVGLQFKPMLVRSGLLRAAKPAALWACRVVWVAVAVFGVVSFAQLGMIDYLFARVQFAFVDFNTPIALLVARYIAVAALVAGVFHYLRAVLALKSA